MSFAQHRRRAFVNRAPDAPFAFSPESHGRALTERIHAMAAVHQVSAGHVDGHLGTTG